VPCLITGTPVENRPQELWRLLHIMAPDDWPDFDDYRFRYCGVRRSKWGREKLDEEEKKRVKKLKTKAGTLTRMDELSAKLAPLMLRRLKHQVLADLPKKSRRSIAVQLPARHMAEYKKASDDIVRWLRGLGQQLRADRAARNKALVRLTALRYLAAVAKVRTVAVEYLRRWADRSVVEPLVVFGYHRNVMLGLWRICQHLRIRVSGIGGRESSERRQAAVDAFMGGWSDVFLAPIESAGAGLNLQRACEALFIERDWSYSRMIQAEDRIHRLGQSRPVTITYLDAVGTVDEHMSELLSDKGKLVRATVDGSTVDPESVAVAVAGRMMRR
jgi:SNF2 family DNA or RNA helicase